MTLRWKIAQSLEIRWWRNYLKNKEKTDYLTAKKAYWVRFLKTLQVEMRPDEKILDAGCGPAGIFMILNECSVDAVDPLVDLYDLQLLHFDKNDYPYVQFYNQSLENFTAAKAYDKVFCLNAINHVADLEVCLDKIVALTPTHGQLILSIDVHKYSFLKALFRVIPGDVLHPHQHDVQDYINKLEKRGCKILKQVCLKPGQIFDYYCLVVEKVDKV